MKTELKDGTRVYAAFLFKHNAMFPYFGANGEARRDFLMDKLRRETEGIEFVGGKIITDIEELEEVEDRDDIDGIFVGVIASTVWPFPIWSLREDPDVDQLRKKPMIVATDFLGGFYPVVDFNAFARKHNLPVLTIQSSDFNDIKKALHKIKVIHSMKNSRILSVGTREIPEGSGIWVEELIKGEPMIAWRTNPDGYAQTVKSVFGPEIVFMTAEDFKDQFYDKIPDADAEKEADAWIDGALRAEVRNKDWVQRMARLYLAMKKSAPDMNIDAIQMDCRTAPAQTIMEIPMKERDIKLYGWEAPAWEFLKKIGALPTFPCGANGKLTSEGIPSVGEGDLDTAVLNLMMQYITDKPGFQNDPVIDTATNQIIYAHCGPTITNWEELGGAIESPYELRMNCAGCGVTFKGSIPLNKTVTSVGLNAWQKKITVHQGRTIGIIDKEDRHAGKNEGKMTLAEKGSLNKFVAEVSDARKIFNNYRPGVFGWHRTLIVGDHRQDIIDIGNLLALTIYEEDK